MSIVNYEELRPGDMISRITVMMNRTFHMKREVTLVLAVPREKPPVIAVIGVVDGKITTYFYDRKSSVEVINR